ncbi:hypothetical protein, partial [Sphingobium yanoikuyae]|uniref:hypothetical protein n=1 Tax=Sphingobium yanoikuyae TaxID=13690 RepID=UPI002430F9F8
MIAFLFWVNRHAAREEDRRAALAYQIEGALNRPAVADCLTHQLPLTGRNWHLWTPLRMQAVNRGLLA